MVARVNQCYAPLFFTIHQYALLHTAMGFLAHLHNKSWFAGSPYYMWCYHADSDSDQYCRLVDSTPRRGEMPSSPPLKEARDRVFMASVRGLQNDSRMGASGTWRTLLDESGSIAQPHLAACQVGGVSRLSTNQVPGMRSRHISAECSNVWDYDVTLRSIKEDASLTSGHFSLGLPGVSIAGGWET